MDAAVPVAQFLLVVGIVEREHRPRVLHLDEAFARFAAHALRRRIRRDQLRMRRFQALQLLHQAVKIGVGKFGSVQDVVQVFVMADFFAQIVNLALNAFVLGDRGHAEDYIVLAGTRVQQAPGSEAGLRAELPASSADGIAGLRIGRAVWSAATENNEEGVFDLQPGVRSQAQTARGRHRPRGRDISQCRSPGRGLCHHARRQRHPAGAGGGGRGL